MRPSFNLTISACSHVALALQSPSLIRASDHGHHALFAAVGSWFFTLGAVIQTSLVGEGDAFAISPRVAWSHALCETILCPGCQRGSLAFSAKTNRSQAPVAVHVGQMGNCRGAAWFFQASTRGVEVPAPFLLFVRNFIRVCPWFTVVVGHALTIVGSFTKLDALNEIFDLVSGLPSLDVHLWRGS